jgi:hypothetical protein
MTIHPAYPSDAISLSPQQRVWALRAAINLFGSEEPNQRLEPMLETQDIDYRKIIERTGPICLRRISIEDGSGIFEIDDELGEPAFVLAVHATDAASIIDLVAWPVRYPENWGTYFAYAGLLGGDAAINPASFIEAPCPIWATPLAWLQSGLRGCVVLNSGLAKPILAQAPGKFQCEDEDHARWLIDSAAVPISKLLVPARRAVA